jgi:hypothetical protein
MARHYYYGNSGDPAIAAARARKDEWNIERYGTARPDSYLAPQPSRRVRPCEYLALDYLDAMADVTIRADRVRGAIKMLRADAQHGRALDLSYLADCRANYRAVLRRALVIRRDFLDADRAERAAASTPINPVLAIAAE